MWVDIVGPSCAGWSGFANSEHLTNHTLTPLRLSHWLFNALTASASAQTNCCQFIRRYEPHLWPAITGSCESGRWPPSKYTLGLSMFEFSTLPFGQSRMFKIIERADFTEIHLRHVPEGHLYMFRVVIIGSRHVIDSARMAENPHSKTAAYKYARQAKEFATNIASERDYLLLPLERFESPILVEAPSLEDEPPAPPRQPQSSQDDNSSPRSSAVAGMVLVVGLLVLLFILSR